MLIKIAWRNVWRHPGRSLTIIGSVTLGLWSILFLNALYQGLIQQRVSDAISLEISHIQIHHPKFRTEWEPQYTLEIPDSSISILKKDRRIKAISQRQLSTGMINSSGGSLGVRIIGIDPDDEKKVSAVSSKMTKGDYLKDTIKHTVLISEKIAQRLKLKLKSKVVIMVQDLNGDIASGAFRVEGIYKTLNIPFDESHVFIKKQYLSDLLGSSSADHEMAILLNDDNDTESIKQMLKKNMAGKEVLSWMEISPEMELLVGSFDQYMMIFMLIVFMAVAFGILNTMLMSVLERTRELGMMFAVGMNKRRVFWMVTFETFFLMLVGLPAGLAAGLLTVNYTGIHGIQFGSAEMMSNFGFANIVYPTLKTEQVFTIVWVIVLITLLSSLYPSLRAITIKPAEAIRK